MILVGMIVVCMGENVVLVVGTGGMIGGMQASTLIHDIGAMLPWFWALHSLLAPLGAPVRM